MNNKRIIVTGAAGFIGANLCMELFRKNEGVHVIGIDNMNDHYDVSIKEWRLAEVERFAAESAGSTWTFHRCNIADKVDNPVSLYVATKKSNELMAHAYSKLYNIPSTGLRFFTVYGPAGRPDMAYFGFTNKLLKGEKIQIFNYGNCKRDFGVKPSTSLRDGLRKFAEWYKEFYKV